MRKFTKYPSNYVSASKGMKVQGLFSWNGYYYGYKSYKNSSGRTNRYYKDKFWDFKNAEEISPDEYEQMATKYNDVMGF